jgi:hypothetical protein
VEGELFVFSLHADGYASFELKADNETIIYGDNLQHDTYTMIAPNVSKIQIIASARLCSARQRTIKNLPVQPQEPMPEPLVKNESNAVTVTAPLPISNEGPANTTAIATQPVTGEAVLDTDRSVVPWVSAFGIITIIVSALVFLRLREGV